MTVIFSRTLFSRLVSGSLYKSYRPIQSWTSLARVSSRVVPTVSSLQWGGSGKCGPRVFSSNVADSDVAKFGGHTASGVKYGQAGVVDYENDMNHAGREVFLNPLIEEFLKAEAPGNRVLDIGCGLGNWSLRAAQLGAKEVFGFDHEEEMVKRAKEATAQCDSVHISVGDASSMPCEDSKYDAAVSLTVVNNLSLTAFDKHFTELYRVLVPGGKALVTVGTASVFDMSALLDKESAGAIMDQLDDALTGLSDNPTSEEIREMLTPVKVTGVAIFIACGDDGKYFAVQNADALHDGQTMWTKALDMILPLRYYSQEYHDRAIAAAGLHLEKIDHGFTKERLDAYSGGGLPGEQFQRLLEFCRRMSENPPLLVYQLSKPVTAK